MLVLLAFLLAVAVPLATALIGVAVFRPKGHLGPVLTAWACGLLVTLGGGWLVWQVLSLFAPPGAQLVAVGAALIVGLLGAPPLLVREVARADGRANRRRDAAAFD